MTRSIISIMTILLLASCTSRGFITSSGRAENQKAKQLLQGIWLDEETDAPYLYIVGDTIYHTDSNSTPVYFQIIKDSLFTYGNEVARYYIDRQTDYTFYFQTLSGNKVKLYKSENESDSLAFPDNSHHIIPTYTEVTQRDSVVYYNNVRYRAYVYINPSTMKVTKTIYSEDGLSVDNVYYDNIMHICVYEGKNCLFASDIRKEQLKEYISEDLYITSILADMEFVHVDKEGFLYQANLCIPDSPVCNIINLLISFDGKLLISAVE
ncbi:DUF4738 domain-containing protein [Bacteroides sp. 224]|uniref:DUF4738 domain-containing protein n=1 Tax=Bacteroides sp. 224 TaxID=2302936 RepID=UPI0013D01208|nr:DUF4738 domain-containing protein [Bacteroides sp. 224]NDV64526.1 DUF4738 domain-containing protein [Bacteroides sp. 224]